MRATAEGAKSAERVPLDERNAGRFLHELGLYDGDDVKTKELRGGVSSTVILAYTPAGDFVLKQPRERFTVADEWIVSTRRVAVEAKVGRWLEARLGSEAVAPVRAFDEANEVIVVQGVPSDWTNLKTRLLAGVVHLEAAADAGRLLARIHDLARELGPDEMREDELFREQRISPYLETAALRAPEVAQGYEGLKRSFFERTDFVHGDFSPKNLFVSPAGDRVCAIDHEVATRGDAAFDLGFFLTHMSMKTIHKSEVSGYITSGQRFLAAYFATIELAQDDTRAAREARAIRYLGGILLARAIGKSKAEYLDSRSREDVRQKGLRIMRDPQPTWDATWRGPAC